jgi:hypothetical protein
MGSWTPSTVLIHLQPSIGGSTRLHNSVAKWKGRASSRVPADANKHSRSSAYVAPCCSLLQTSFGEQTSHRSAYRKVRLRTPLPAGLGICVICFLHSLLSSAFLSLRQVVISFASGMNALQSLNTSGVHASRCSVVPCWSERTGETVAQSKVSAMHDLAKGIDRSSVRLFWLSLIIRVSR